MTLEEINNELIILDNKMIKNNKLLSVIRTENNTSHKSLDNKIDCFCDLASTI